MQSTRTGDDCDEVPLRRRPAGSWRRRPLPVSLATRWMAPRPRRDDSAPFYRCVMRRKSRGHFCRITQPFDRRFPIVRPRLGGLLRHRCSHRGGVSWRVSSGARATVFESGASLGDEEVTGPRSSSSVIEQERWSADDAASSSAEKSFAWRQRDRGGRYVPRRRHPARRCAAVSRRERVALRVVLRVDPGAET